MPFSFCFQKHLYQFHQFLSHTEQHNCKCCNHCIANHIISIGCHDSKASYQTSDRNSQNDFRIIGAQVIQVFLADFPHEIVVQQCK